MFERRLPTFARCFVVSILCLLVISEREGRASETPFTWDGSHIIKLEHNRRSTAPQAEAGLNALKKTIVQHVKMARQIRGPAKRKWSYVQTCRDYLTGLTSIGAKTLQLTKLIQSIDLSLIESDSRLYQYASQVQDWGGQEQESRLYPVYRQHFWQDGAPLRDLIDAHFGVAENLIDPWIYVQIPMLAILVIAKDIVKDSSSSNVLSPKVVDLLNLLMGARQRAHTFLRYCEGGLEDRIRQAAAGA